MNLPVAVAVGRENSLVFRRGSMVGSITRVKEDGGVKRRRAALRMVDRQLTKGNFKLALSLVKQLQRQPSPFCLCGFAAARQVPRRVSSVDELHLSVTQTSALQSLLDAILDSIKNSLQTSPLEESSESGEDNDLYLEDDIVEHKQVVHHEAGHFLVGYLLGVLPKQYKISSMEDNVADASVKFVGFEFLTELEDVVLSNPGHQANKRKLSSTVSSTSSKFVLTVDLDARGGKMDGLGDWLKHVQALSKLACVLVGGLVAEHLAFGHSKGHHRDVEKLYRVLTWLTFTEDEANTVTRWAVLNTLTILNRHSKARSALVEAMSQGRSIGFCIDFIENNLKHEDI